ncbi:methionyl-tRNA formyltransferase [Sporosarcina sp. FSL K6-5500]|uniref:methionyl-tRNA formyltransferase n=1 Tax=Sporosarcina sp. FSL K6-5500 TaxID=2921558 RepID=UPI0030FB47D3
MNIIIAYSKPGYENIVLDLTRKYPDICIHAIETPENLTVSILEEIRPDYIFFPHWSFLVSESIYKKYNCIIFHMTDLPFGRGGSPLQNLIARGIYETKISAIQCVEELDAGPVYLKAPLSLYGNAEEIYLRAASTVTEMIVHIIETNPEPVPQVGDIVEFKRRQPHEGNISELETLEQVYDYIRMLDAEGYPKAFIEIGKFVFEFERSALKEGEICADVRIKLKEVDK